MAVTRDVLRSLEDKVKPAHTALLVIDVQNDFCHETGGLAQRGGDMSQAQSMIPRLSDFIRSAHAAGVLVIFFRIIQSPDHNSDAWESLEEGGGPRLVVEGTWGADYYPGLPHDCVHLEMVKHRHSGFVGTGLDQLLRERGCRTVVLGGVATNVCVEGTAREAADRDYYVVVLEDGTGAARADLHEMSLENVRRYLGEVVPCGAVAATWSPQRAPTTQGGS
jgi:ureidoacrylate peracid hydrolase